MTGTENTVHIMGRLSAGTVTSGKYPRGSLMPSITVTHPDWRPASGESRMGRAVHLPEEAALAYQVWVTIWNNRVENVTTGQPDNGRMRGVDIPRTCAAIAAGGMLGKLLVEAITDALTREVTASQRENDLGAYEAARLLYDRYRELVPAPEPLTPVGYADETCRHGRRYSASCDECGV